MKIKKHRHRNRSRHRKIIPLKIIAVLLAVIISVCGVLFAVNLWEVRQKTQFDQQTAEVFASVIEYKGKTYELNENVETMLIIGLDKFESAETDSYNNDMQADFIMLLVIDNENEKFMGLHINRDTIADIDILGVDGGSIEITKQQIALAHTYGNGKEVSCRNTAVAVSRLLNVEVDHYVSVTMDAVEVYNDFVGGVELTVLDDFSGIDDTLIKGEKVTLMGDHALNYVRSRYGLDDSTNSRRMERQRQYMDALYEKTVSCIENDDSFILNAASKLSSSIVSDCSANRLQSVAEKFSDYEFMGMQDLEGKSVAGEKFMEFYPDEESLKETVVNLFYKPKD